MSCEEGDMSVECDSCKSRFDRYDLLDDCIFHSADEDKYLPAGCSNCMSAESVAKFGDGYLCTRCLQFYDQLIICNCCDHMSDSVPEFSHIRGCNFCDGDQRYLDD